MTSKRQALAAGTEELLEEAEYVRRSLDELEAEHAAGELDGADYDALHARYEARAVALEQALQAVPPAAEATARRDVGSPRATGTPADSPPENAPPQRRRTRASHWLATRRRRLVIGWSAALCFAVAGCLLGLSLGGVAPFAATQPTTLSVAAQIRIELGEAGVLASDGEVAQAVAVYDKVLELDANQPEALADGGWLVRLAGVSSHNRQVIAGGDAEIATAVKVAPAYALARAYDGVALFDDDHSVGAAVAEFQAMLADKPTHELVTSVAPTAVKAFHAAHRAVPAAFT